MLSNLTHILKALPRSSTISFQKQNDSSGFCFYPALIKQCRTFFL